MAFNIRPSQANDLPLQMQMIAHSRSLMRQNGNHAQWEGYPTEEDLRDDHLRKVSYIIEQDGTPVATFALVPGIEPTYRIISEGRWIDPISPYATIHRLAALPNTKGIAQIAFNFAKQHFNYLRFDTHALNSTMLHIAHKEGFIYSGIVFMDDGSPRKAYEWWRWHEVTPALAYYIESKIIPEYQSFDLAHQTEHVRRVIARAMCYARQHNLFNTTPELTPDTLYTAAAFHDIGLSQNREFHHIISASLISSNETIKQWFSQAEIMQIAYAALDHRASSSTPPRSLLGKIIAEADLDIEPYTIIRRTIEYGLSHYPDLDREAHFQRTLQHLNEKYSPQGYIHLWLDPSPNQAPLSELRSLIADPTRLRTIFDHYMP